MRGPPVCGTGGPRIPAGEPRSGERRVWWLRRLRGRRSLACGPVAPLGHKLIELRPILGKAKPLQKLLEFALLVLEPAQRFGAILIEGAVAARGPRTPPIA